MKAFPLPCLLVLAVLSPACSSSKKSSSASPAAPATSQHLGTKTVQQPVTNPTAPVTTPVVTSPIINPTTAAISAAGISGWWMAQTASRSNDGSDDSCYGSACDDTHVWISSNYICKEFLLINEAQMKMAAGWECWARNSWDKTIYFDIDEIGTITAESTTQISYTVTGGCSAADLGAQVQNVVLGTNNGSATMIAANADNTSLLLGKIPASSSYLQFSQPGYKVVAGCFSQTDGSTFTQQDTFQTVIAGMSN